MPDANADLNPGPAPKRRRPRIPRRGGVGEGKRPSRKPRLDPMVAAAKRRRRRDLADATPPAQPGTRQLSTTKTRLDATLERMHDRWLAFLRPSRTQSVLALLLAVLAFAVVVQVRTRGEDSTYATARRADLVQLLDGLDAERQRMETELAELDTTKSELSSGADRERVAREQAAERTEQLNILAGTIPASGPGIAITIGDPEEKITADLLLDAVEELRDAGAEVIEINDAVRVVASSWFSTGPDGLIVDGQAVGFPMTVEAIGNPHSLEEAARFRGGLVSEITGGKVSGTVQIRTLDPVLVRSVHEPTAFQYARPR